MQNEMWLKHMEGDLRKEVAELQAEVAKLKGQRSHLRSAIKKQGGV